MVVDMRIYSPGMVARRLIPLLAVLAVAFAPVALVTCEASCVSHAVQASADSSHHHHHGAASSAPSSTATAGDSHHHTPAAAASLSPVALNASHPCSHGDGLPAFSGISTDTLVPPAVVVAGFQLPEASSSRLSRHSRGYSRSPVRTTLTTQLRV
jgi:hypothetical protein